MLHHIIHWQIIVFALDTFYYCVWLFTTFIYSLFILSFCINRCIYWFYISISIYSTYLYISTYINTNIYIVTNIHVCIYINMYIHAYMYLCIYTWGYSPYTLTSNIYHKHKSLLLTNKKIMWFIHKVIFNNVGHISFLMHSEHDQLIHTLNGYRAGYDELPSLP